MRAVIGRLVYAADFLLFGLAFPLRMSANSTQRFTVASSFTEFELSV